MITILLATLVVLLVLLPWILAGLTALLLAIVILLVLLTRILVLLAALLAALVLVCHFNILSIVPEGGHGERTDGGRAAFLRIVLIEINDNGLET